MWSLPLCLRTPTMSPYLVCMCGRGECWLLIIAPSSSGLHKSQSYVCVDVSSPVPIHFCLCVFAGGFLQVPMEGRSKNGGAFMVQRDNGKKVVAALAPDFKCVCRARRLNAKLMVSVRICFLAHGRQRQRRTPPTGDVPSLTHTLSHNFLSLALAHTHTNSFSHTHTHIHTHNAHPLQEEWFVVSEDPSILFTKVRTEELDTLRARAEELKAPDPTEAAGTFRLRVTEEEEEARKGVELLHMHHMHGSVDEDGGSSSSQVKTSGSLAAGSCRPLFCISETECLPLMVFACIPVPRLAHLSVFICVCVCVCFVCLSLSACLPLCFLCVCLPFSSSF